MLKSTAEVLNSIRTTNLLLWALIFFFIAGALLMPGNQAFDTMQSVRLFDWIKENPIYLTWWVVCSIIVLLLLAINTVFCSFNSLLKKRERKKLALVLAPQVVHAGFCFLLLAHLLSASGSFRQSAVFYEGKSMALPSGANILIKKIRYRLEYGRAVDPSAEITVKRVDGTKEEALVSLNDPFFVDGTGIYIKSIFFRGGVSVLIEFAKDPGALWALAGSVLFSVGTALFFFLKIRYEIPESIDG